MSKSVSKIFTGVKYVYLVVFFVLLAGFFHPLITGVSGDNVIIGTLVLFVGLAGAVMVYKAATSEKRQVIYLGGGFGLIAISAAYIFQITGRV